MKQNRFLSEEMLVQRAIDVLLGTLGPVETTRFLSLPVKKRIESVRQHRVWQSKLEKDHFFDAVFGNPPG